MDHNIVVPEEYRSSFQKLIPHFPAALRADAHGLESIVLYLKVGGEKLARIALEAYRQNQILSDAETQKRLREKALEADMMARSEDEDESDEDEDEEDSEEEEF